MGERPAFVEWYKDLSRHQKAGIWAGVALVFYTVFGFVAAPLILKAVLVKKLPQVLDRQVAIEKIRLNPYSLSATIEGFHLAKKEGAADFAYFDRLHVNLESLSLFKKALIIKSVSVSGPFVDFEYLGDRTYNFSDLIEGKAEGKEKGADQGKALFSINNIEIKDGNIKFHDLPKGKVHHVVNLNLAVPSVSNLPSSIEVYVQPAFSAVINGTSTSLGGVTKPFAESFATEVDINMVGINIPEYLAYLPNPTGLAVKSAMMDINTKLTYLSGNDNTSRLSLTGNITIRGVNVADREGRTYLRLPATTLTLADSNLLEKEIRLTEIAVEAPQLELLRLAGGDLLPLSLLSSSADDAAGPPATEPGAGKEEEQIRLTIDRFALENGEIIFSDQALQTPARSRLSGISVKASSLSTIPETAGEISIAMLLNDTGRISGAGNLTIEPLAIKSSLEADSVQLKDFQSYLSEQARIIIERGVAGLQGNLEVLSDPGGDSILHCSGSGYLTDLALVDTLVGDDLIKWKELQVKNVDFSSQPSKLSIGEISWQDPYAKVLVNDDGTLNFATLYRDDRDNDQESPAEPPPAGEDLGQGPTAEQTKKITINKISFINGQIQFLDRNINPAYGATLSSFNGMITGLSNQKEALAAVKFDGKVDKQAPLTVSGEINPLRQDNYADIKIDFTAFNMSPLSPYTGKFIGYRTGTGKLNLDLHYNIAGRKLDSTNKAFLDQFTLGEKVDSPDATSLPVNLAIALLKNRQGEIFLDVPVSGDLDDPEFSIGGIVVRVIVNLIAKAATSPFALLGSLIPAGEDIQHLSFEAGSSSLTTDVVDKLAVVAKVLYERPGLKMDISGRVDRESDSKALARLNMEKQIKFAKLKKTGTGKGGDVDYQAITVSTEEYPNYLSRVYKKALKAATTEERKAARKIKPTGEAERLVMMEEFLLARIKIEDEDLRLLAIDRANTVLSNLIEEGQVEPGRLFMVEPQLGGVQDEMQQPGIAMVELSIK
ncbi:MAG: DUF748 domain-containing protein [Thermodesulfobacteriota bacterium]